jgi:hypothetical protein
VTIAQQFLQKAESLQQFGGIRWYYQVGGPI